ncbi:sensor histidine kinase [Paractinoplanes abujensis]|uniref:Two-component system sensor histidine kinase DesK n=1 Tax=Paractinoplanes abujensis TaxID=882441 RepID=A0A7W7CME0_9ACTN|nr:histidine kinase [Actinoplanes abujensis]MBB4691229.1 two-component system sensor histidine kinase DesK [Actinoplanes abujensis]
MRARSLHITEATQGRLRRLNLYTALPPIMLAAFVVVAVDVHTWWHVLVLAPGVIAALVAFERWTANDIGRVALPCLTVAAAVWPLGALVVGSPNAYWGVTSVASLAIPRMPRHQYLAAAALVAFVAGVGASRLLIDPAETAIGVFRLLSGADDVFLKFVLFPTGVTLLVIVLSFVGERFYDIVQELETSREREAELAVIRERVRFAGDLHDIQGHTLHVVKLKTALAQKLVHSDPDRAADELREINDLVSDTIRQTKELAYAQRRLNLSAELENAKNLFEAAGIRVRITRESEPEARTSEMLGQVLRETTTNILRHAQATQVRVVLTASGITIVNDGAAGHGTLELRGLSALRQRIADDGGELVATRTAGEFTTAAAYPAGGVR